MTQAKRNIDQLPLLGEFIEKERLAKQLVDPLARIVASELPGLPNKETGCELSDFRTEVGPWTNGPLITSQEVITSRWKRNHSPNAEVIIAVLAFGRKEEAGKNVAESISPNIGC